MPPPPKHRPEGAPKRRRRNESAKEAFRSVLVDNARQLMLEEGLEAVSIRNIALRSGVTPMAFYRYFENKAEVVQRLWAATLSELHLELSRELERLRHPVERLECFLLSYFGHWERNPAAARCIFLGDTSNGRGSWDVYFLQNPAARPVLELWNDLIHHALPDDDTRAGRTRLVRELMFAQTLGLLCVTVLGSTAPSVAPLALWRAALPGLLGLLTATTVAEFTGRAASVEGDASPG